MTLEKAKQYKTAYHPILEAFVGIKEVRPSQVNKNELFFICTSYAFDGEVAFTEGELKDFCL